MIQPEPDLSIYPGLDMMFSESCRPLLDNIAAQIISDPKIDLEKLAITAYADTSFNVSTLLNACKHIASEIGRYTGKNLYAYSINLSGYNGNSCEKHSLPWRDTLSLDFILFTDSFTDAALLRHAHYVISKQGVDDEKIRVAAVFYIPKIHSSLEFDSYSLDGKVLALKRFSKKPDYVGQVINL
jgi:hypothetical protein